jgi:hypothetical protein
VAKRLAVVEAELVSLDLDAAADRLVRHLSQAHDAGATA